MNSEFILLLCALQKWRNADHADHLVLSRHEVIVLLEGIRTREPFDPYVGAPKS